MTAPCHLVPIEFSPDPRFWSLELLRRYIDAGSECPIAGALTAREREIEELTLP